MSNTTGPDIEKRLMAGTIFSVLNAFGLIGNAFVFGSEALFRKRLSNEKLFQRFLSYDVKRSPHLPSTILCSP